MSQNERSKIDLSQFQSQLSLGNRIYRALWGVVWLCAFRVTPRIAFGWRRWVLRLMGAQVGPGVRIYNSARVYYPPNLELGRSVVIAPEVDLYCVDRITIGDNAMVSQYSYLCSASHDHTQPELPLISAPICIEPQAWICADVFIGPGVTVGEGTVVGARSTVFRDLEPWIVCGGNPARFIKPRTIGSD